MREYDWGTQLCDCMGETVLTAVSELTKLSRHVPMLYRILAERLTPKIS